MKSVSESKRAGIEQLGRRGDGLPHLLDSPELAELLGVTPRHVRRLVAERRIPYVKWGHFIRFDPDEVEGWLAGVRVPADDPAGAWSGRPAG